MRIETVNHSNITHAFPCLEQFRDITGPRVDIDRSVHWVMRSMHNGFRGKIAFDGSTPIGNIFYCPLKYSIAPIETAVEVIHLRCLYMRPDSRGQGIGQSLIAAMKADAGNFAGVVVSATETLSYMHNSIFREFGFSTVKESDGIHYMYLPIRTKDIKIKLIPPKYKPAGAKTEVTLFNDDFCPFWNYVSTRIREIAISFGNAIDLKEISLNQHRSRQYGLTATCLIDGENAFPGDVTEDAIRQKIQEAVTRRTAALNSAVDPRRMTLNQ
jgi:GNAT superfamily N-acetyltransferase